MSLLISDNAHPRAIPKNAINAPITHSGIYTPLLHHGFASLAIQAGSVYSSEHM
jgi:hypothetical protein